MIGERSKATPPNRAGGIARRSGPIAHSVAVKTNRCTESNTPPVGGNQLRMIRRKISPKAILIAAARSGTETFLGCCHIDVEGSDCNEWQTNEMSCGPHQILQHQLG